MDGQILIVDDEPLVCKSLSEVVRRAGYEVFTANDGYEAIETLQQENISIAITDINMPKMNGLEFIKRAKSIAPDISVIVITGFATVESAVEAMKSGALDYITKPFSPSKICSIIEKTINYCAYNKEYLPTITSDLHKIVTSDPKMLSILDKVKLIAQSDANVLIQGESGTGKELIARAIHKHSNRINGPYVAINCAAIPESLMESELFGHEKGSFTSAVSRRIGKFELANGGTLLLDEISELAKPFQAKLLRAIQEKAIVRVGGNDEIKVDVRIIATTNKDLAEEVDSGRFREDLFYRLCVIPLYLPPLRERKDDIPILAQYFAEKFCIKTGRKKINIADDVLEVLKNYSWPGNIRELENTIERAVALSMDGTIRLDNIFWNKRKSSSRYISLEVGTPLDKVEKEVIIRTLEEVGNNKQKAAEILGITSKTIRSKLRQYGYYNDNDSEKDEDFEN
ncbi:MAG: sigma-54-dependent transcriptional regulator [bacterium]